eukprot:392177-Hanusia_phi.AAC.1
MSAFLVGGKKFKSDVRWTNSLAHLAVKGDDADRTATNVLSPWQLEKVYDTAQQHCDQALVVICCFAKPSVDDGRREQQEAAFRVNLEEEEKIKEVEWWKVKIKNEQEDDSMLVSQERGEVEQTHQEAEVKRRIKQVPELGDSSQI